MKTRFSLLTLLISLAFGLSPARAQNVEPPVAYNPADIVPLKKSSADFRHPGVLLSEADLLRMREKANAGYEPWKTAFEAMRRGAISLDYQPAKTVEFIDAAGSFAISNDSSAAFNLAMMWNITRDARYAAKAREVLLSWAGNKGNLIDTHLQVGPAARNFAVAAEILRWSYPGWTGADTDALIAMFKRKEGPAKYSLIDVLKLYHYVNHGTVTNAGLMAVGAFMSDPELYNLAVNRFFSIESGSGVYYNVNPKTGQNAESNRDQAHSQGNIAPLGEAAQMMRVQGSDAGFEAGKDAEGLPLLLKAFQFTAAYNLGYEPADYRGWDDSKRWDSRRDTNRGAGGVATHNRGHTLSIYELIYSHYKYIAKVPAKQINFIEELIQIASPQRNGGAVADMGLLFFSPEARQSAAPPVKLAAFEPSKTDAMPFGRVAAAKFDSSGGRLAREKNQPTTEIFDGHPIINLTRIGNYLVYKGFQFGDFADGKAVMALRAATNNNSGNVYADFYADVDGSLKLAGQELDPGITGGQYLGRVNLKTTGGWQDFNTFYGALQNIPSGKKGDLYLVFGGEEERGRTEWLMNVDWFKMAPRFAHDVAPVNAPLANNGTISFPAVDFDAGARYFYATISTSAPGSLEIRQGDAKAPLLGQLSIPNTQGQARQMRVALKNVGAGTRPLSLLYQGAGAQLQSFHFAPLAARTVVVPASSHLGKKGVAAGPMADDGNGSLEAKNEAWIAFPRVGFGTGMSRVSAHIASNTAGQIEVRTLSRDGTKTGQPISQGEYGGNVGTLIATLDVPDTGGAWQTVVTKMPTPISRQYLIFLVFRAQNQNGFIRVSDFQFDPVNAPPMLANATLEVSKGQIGRFALPTLDEDGDRITSTLISAPQGATLNAQTGELTWKPNAAGTFPIVVELFDGQLRSRSTINMVVR